MRHCFFLFSLLFSFFSILNLFYNSTKLGIFLNMEIRLEFKDTNVISELTEVCTIGLSDSAFINHT